MPVTNPQKMMEISMYRLITNSLLFSLCWIVPVQAHIPPNVETRIKSEVKSIDIQLIQAVCNGNKTKIKALIQAGADVHACDSDKRTALMWAAACGYSDIVQTLIEIGSDLNARDKDDRTPLILAAMLGHADTVQVLIEAGANIDVRDNKGA